MSSSENMDAASIISARFAAASSRSSAGISPVRTTSPFSPSKYRAFMSTRSTTPWKFISRPIGICRATALWPSFVLSWAITRDGSAPLRSHLLTKAMLGTL